MRIISLSKIKKMSNAIDHEKKERVDKAATMEKVPLLQLDRLIKERRAHALEQNVEAVESLNQMIKQLLAL
jgi:hypothetical protein